MSLAIAGIKIWLLLQLFIIDFCNKITSLWIENSRLYYNTCWQKRPFDRNYLAMIFKFLWAGVNIWRRGVILESWQGDHYRQQLFSNIIYKKIPNDMCFPWWALNVCAEGVNGCWWGVVLGVGKKTIWHQLFSN